MSISYYSIRIYTEEKYYNEINQILGVVSPDKPSSIWNYEVVRGENDPYYDFINEFLDLLEGKFDQLQKLEIGRNRIKIWLVYEYDNECNMEFDANELKRLGDNGIGLCISCY